MTKNGVWIQELPVLFLAVSLAHEFKYSLNKNNPEIYLQQVRCQLCINSLQNLTSKELSSPFKTARIDSSCFYSLKKIMALG